MLKAVFVDHVKSRLKHGDTFLISIHFFIVGVGLSFNLFGYCVHKSSNNFVKLLLVFDIVNRPSISSWGSCLYLVFDDTNISVYLSKADFDNT